MASLRYITQITYDSWYFDSKTVHMLLQNFTLDEFRQMCILSGCDYLASVPGIGLTTAHKLMKKYARNVNNVSANRDHILSSHFYCVTIQLEM